MPKRSAGILLYRRREGVLEVFLVHPGGPFWKNKDAGAWSIPKGEYLESEDPLAAAIREFSEETGVHLNGQFVSLDEIRQAGGKVVSGWALEGDLDPQRLQSNLFSIEWPKGSGKIREFPEVDRGEWFTIEAAQDKILKSQAGFLERLMLIAPPA